MEQQYAVWSRRRRRAHKDCTMQVLSEIEII